MGDQEQNVMGHFRSDWEQNMVEQFGEFLSTQYREKVTELSQRYPDERRSLYVDWDDLVQFDSDLAEDALALPDKTHEYATEALRYDEMSMDLEVGSDAHVRIRNLPDGVTVDEFRVHDDRIGKFVSVQGVIREADDIRPQVTYAAFECQRCGTITEIPADRGEPRMPHECQGCERQGPFQMSTETSEYVDSQQFTLRSTTADLSAGTDPFEIQGFVEDDIVGVTAGDDVTVNGILRLEQDETNESSFEPYLDAVSITQSPESPLETESHVTGSMSMDKYLNTASETVASLPETGREPGTKTKLITPFIEALGWNKFDNDEFRLEYTDSQTDKRVDYALFATESESPDVLVEAKQLGKPLVQYETQIYEYLRLFSAEYGLLTDGESHRVYHNPPQTKPEMVAKLGLHDISDAAIIAELQPSSFTTGSDTATDADEESATGPD